MEIKLQQHAEKLTKKDIPFLIGLSLLGLFLFLFYTWAMPLIDPDEPRYASTARDMILNGNWIVPHFNGVPRINKPPLFYWAIAISYKIFGINEFGARLPSALAAIGTVLITYLWGKRLEDRKNGFWAGMILMASPLFFLISRFCITDMLLTFFVCSSLYIFFVEYTEWCSGGLETRPYRRLFLYFLLSMVFLVKGPVGILLFILITLCFLLWMRDLRYLRRLWYLPGFLLFLGIICAWGIPFWLSLGTQQISSLLSQEMSGRFVSGYAHPEPFYYYLPVFIIGFFPWSLFVFITFIHTIKQRKIMPVEEKRQVYFFCSWLILTLVFFSMSHSKLLTYVLPLSPSIALLTTLLSRWEIGGKLGKRHLWVLWPTLFVSAMIPIALIFTMHKWIPAKHGLSTIHIAIPIIILLIGTLIALFIFIRSKRFSQLKKIFCFTNCIFLVITITYSAKYLGTFRSTKDIVEKCLSDKGENYALFSYARTVPSLVFYSGKDILEIEDYTRLKTILPNQETSIYIVMSLNDYQKKQDWIQKRKLHAVCQNNAHVILKRESN
ncbi:MAG: glycosyltransferase family 39 protein [Planctomycetes bacterium]|nr:glycosyltransferase family 39 protein [Planctomycetota bacterium]